MSSANCDGEVSWRQKTGASSSLSMPMIVRGVPARVAGGRSATARSWPTSTMVSRSLVRPDERLVEACRGSSRILGRVSWSGSLVTKTTCDVVAVALVEPGQRGGEVVEDRRADVGAPDVAEEHQRQPLVGVGGERERLAVGVGEVGVGHRVGVLEHGAAERGRVVAATAPDESGQGEQEDGDQSDGASVSSAAGTRRGHVGLRPTPRCRAEGPHARRTPPARSSVRAVERAQAGRPVVEVVEQGAHEGRADDHAVGERSDVGGLVAGADAEADTDGQVGGRRGCGRRAGRRGRWWRRGRR